MKSNDWIADVRPGVTIRMISLVDIENGRFIVAAWAYSEDDVYDEEVDVFINIRTLIINLFHEGFYTLKVKGEALYIRKRKDNHRCMEI